MSRQAFAFEVDYGKTKEFREKLGRKWTKITAWLDENRVKNFSLWGCGSLVFGYCETDEEFLIPSHARTELMEMNLSFEKVGSWISEPGRGMRLMYHNFGIPRENKELIRHRVFMTRLKPGCAEEYKSRHDKLVESRGDSVDPGPDSNFSIWSAGGYIFGYDEIDVTMERDETSAEHENTVAWESRQLGIMDWFTNDVDWLTGEVHPSVIRLGWHA